MLAEGVVLGLEIAVNPANVRLRTDESVHASVVFEQSYSGVDGDSASAEELFAGR
jgi:predicted ATP-dependent protease